MFVCPETERHINFHNGRMDGKGDRIGGADKTVLIKENNLFLPENYFWTLCSKWEKNETHSQWGSQKGRLQVTQVNLSYPEAFTLCLDLLILCQTTTCSPSLAAATANLYVFCTRTFNLSHPKGATWNLAVLMLHKTILHFCLPHNSHL